MREVMYVCMTKKKSSSTGMLNSEYPKTPSSGYVQTPVRMRYESHGIVAVTATVVRKSILVASTRERKGFAATVRKPASGIVNLACLNEGVSTDQCQVEC
jgi:hypothetical protein